MGAVGAEAGALFKERNENKGAASLACAVLSTDDSNVQPAFFRGEDVERSGVALLELGAAHQAGNELLPQLFGADEVVLFRNRNKGIFLPGVHELHRLPVFGPPKAIHLVKDANIILPSDCDPKRVSLGGERQSVDRDSVGIGDRHLMELCTEDGARSST